MNADDDKEYDEEFTEVDSGFFIVLIAFTTVLLILILCLALI